MDINDIIEYIKSYVDKMDMTLCEGASNELIQKMEQACCIALPEDIKVFYKFTNGFEVDEDIFNLISLEEMIENAEKSKKDPVYIAEYEIYSDMWALEVDPINGSYQISNNNRHGEKVVLTNSFAEFIECFLTGGVFEQGGLYDRGEEMRPNK